MSETFSHEIKPTKALLANIDLLASPASRRKIEARRIEAEELMRAINLEIKFSKDFSIRKARAGFLFGEGQIDQLKEAQEEFSAEILIVNHKISPVQQRNLERELNIKVIDRTGLILEIFGARAKTREGAMQVELAHFKYQKSRLVRSWTHLERQRGGRGFLGGPGERQIESDRRQLDEQIAQIEARISKVQSTRALQRAGRKKHEIPMIALIGYTNAGKSTLFNRLTNAEVMAEDMLFATLDPTIRKGVLNSGEEVMFSDTVGFVSDLPTELIVAFRATLEEVIYADLVLHIIDASHEDREAQIKDVEEVIEALKIKGQEFPPIINVYNKIDQASNEQQWGKADRIEISALTGQGVENFLSAIDEQLAVNIIDEKIHLAFGYGEARSWLFNRNVVINEEIDETGYYIDIRWEEVERLRFIKQFGQIF